MNSNYDKLIAILREVFQIDQADLDFGIYRIMNQKREEIDSFLQKTLLPQVKEVIRRANLGDATAIKAELDKAIENARSLGVDPDQVPKVKELKERLKEAQPVEMLEEEIFSHLTSFFKRYYDDGDFISMRRYKKDVYAIPYEGEEVKLHWANYDQYYIKSSEYLKNYQFRVGKGKSVRFELAEASSEKDNNKATSGKERYFRIHEEKPLEVQGDRLTIYFTYLPGEKKESREQLDTYAFEVIKKHLPPDWMGDLLTQGGNDRTLLEKHINEFTARNTFDYFIHKDLGGFLRRELDFYIKNEVLQLDDMSEAVVMRQLTKVKALRQIAEKIITFLEQIENFQKRLWLKKKFVVESHYCITLDRIPENYYPEIAENDAQWEEWERLFVISEIPHNLFTGGSDRDRLTILKKQPYLVLDTRFFPEDFKQRLLGEFQNLDEETDGLLINSENFQALSLLNQRYKDRVQAIYIDPPYNATATEILYKNNFKHSSWLSFIENRVNKSRPFLKETGCLCLTIDDYEYHRLLFLLKDIFGSNHLATVPIRNNPSGRSTVQGFAINHEYGVFFSNTPDIVSVGRLPHSKEQKDRYSEKDEEGKNFEWENFRKSSAASNRSDRPKQFYPIFFNLKKKRLRIPEMEWNASANSWNINENLSDGEIEIYPLRNKTEKVWLFGIERARDEVDNLKVVERDGTYEVYKKKYINVQGTLPRTWWDNPKYSARDHGTRTLKYLFGPSSSFDFPKAVTAVEDSLRVLNLDDAEIALDYFAGSGTTGHAVINLNREDDGNRKYILVEMGEYFNTVTKPRIQKVIYSEDWKDGKPVSRKGSSHLFKYMRLESYEDTLNNLRLERSDAQEGMLALDDQFYEEYMLGYMLNMEAEGSLLSVEDFSDPFGYQLRIIENNEAVPTRIDLVETFNYLMGLHVETIRSLEGFRIVTGTNRDGERVLILWRNVEEKSNEALNQFFQEQGYDQAEAGLDHIYVNGDCTLETLRKEDTHWQVHLLEEEFLKRMFDTHDV